MKSIKELLITEKKVKQTKSEYKDDFGEKYCIKVSNIPEKYKHFYFLLKDDDYYYYNGDSGSKYVESAKFYWNKKDAIDIIKYLKENKNYTPKCELLTVKTEVVNVETIE